MKGEDIAEISQWNYNVMWLESVISRHVGIRVAMACKGGYWYAYNPAIGEHRVTDLLKGERRAEGDRHG